MFAKGAVLEYRKKAYHLVSKLDEHTMIGNVSSDGIFIASDSDVRLGSIVQIGFYLPGYTRPINLIGEVIRKKETKADIGGKYGYGILTMEIKEADKIKVSEYILGTKKTK
jgi:hypothetical protein